MLLTKLGNFELLEVIGRGGMGTVYRGIDPLIGRAVAVKVIRMLGYKDSEEQAWLKDRLFREAQAAGKLNHSGIVTIYQVGEEQDMAYIAMEFVDGPNLQELIGRESPQMISLCEILLEAATALDYAHARGLVHRDVKPANLMITAAGVTKVTDFGIAKTMIGQTETKAGMVLGTPFYMSPEQILGKPLDGRSDQFALAVIAYEMVTGRKPFQAEQVTSVCYQILHEEPLSPEDVNPSVRQEVAVVIKRGLSKQADDRYPSCTQFAEELVAAVRIVSRAEPKLSPPVPLPAKPEPAVVRQLPARPSSISRIQKVLAGAAVLAGILVISSLASYSLRPLPQLPLPRSAIVALPPPSLKPSPMSHAARELEARDDHTSTILPAVPVLKSGVTGTPTVASHMIDRPPEALPAAAPTVPAQPLTGMMVWTGQLRVGDLLTIDNGHASAGSLSGGLPGRAVHVDVLPAQLLDSGLTAYTADPAHLNRRKAPAAREPVTIVFDPRHSTDLVVFERPAEENGWLKLSIRVNTPLVRCVVAWGTE